MMQVMRSKLLIAFKACAVPTETNPPKKSTKKNSKIFAVDKQILKLPLCLFADPHPSLEDALILQETRRPGETNSLQTIESAILSDACYSRSSKVRIVLIKNYTRYFVFQSLVTMWKSCITSSLLIFIHYLITAFNN